MSLLRLVKSMSRDDLKAQLQLALSSVEDSRSFLGHGQITQSDTLGALTPIDVNLMLASQDRFLSCLCPYLAPWHCATLCYSDFMSESLMLALQGVILASCEDATHKSARQVANLGLSQSSRPSSQTPSHARASQCGAPRGCGSHAAGSHLSGQQNFSSSQGKSSTSKSGSHQNQHSCHTRGHGCGGASGSAASR